MYKVIDIEKWNRKSQYIWFSSFENPCYGMDVTIDVTEVVNYSKKTKTSFFINFLFIVTKSLNSIREMRLRIVNDEVREYDTINPTFTVMTNAGFFENAGIKMVEQYDEFYKHCRNVIDNVKVQKEKRIEYNKNNNYDDYYMTCTPWLYYSSMTHPLPSNNKESSSVPRICWSKFISNGDRIVLTLNITVSHSLVDGYPLSIAFNTIQENCNNCIELFK